MTLASDLANILKPEKLVSAATDGSIVLRDGTSRMEVRIVGGPATAVRLERIGHSSGLRDGPWKRVCDYLLVVESGEDRHAIFIELKKTLTEEQRPRDQLRRSTPLLAYLRAVCEVESGDGPTEVDIDALFHRRREGRSETGQAVGEFRSGPPGPKRAVRGYHDPDVHRGSRFARHSARSVSSVVGRADPARSSDGNST